MTDLLEIGRYTQKQWGIDQRNTYLSINSSFGPGGTAKVLTFWGLEKKEEAESKKGDKGMLKTIIFGIFLTLYMAGPGRNRKKSGIKTIAGNKPGPSKTWYQKSRSSASAKLKNNTKRPNRNQDY